MCVVGCDRGLWVGFYASWRGIRSLLRAVLVVSGLIGFVTAHQFGEPGCGLDVVDDQVELVPGGLVEAPKVLDCCLAAAVWIDQKHGIRAISKCHDWARGVWIFQAPGAVYQLKFEVSSS